MKKAIIKSSQFLERIYDAISFKLYGDKKCCPNETTWR
jgi:hypothetical protein